MKYKIHKKPAELSEEAHNRVKIHLSRHCEERSDEAIFNIENEINSEVPKLWNIKY
ncbi:MAG: hypothetical protein AB1349_09080 [Elusimicrobiota bacterium]